jgi:hypothetical protein
MLEDGFLRISNSLLEALLKLDLTGTQWSIRRSQGVGQAHLPVSVR